MGFFGTTPVPDDVDSFLMTQGTWTFTGDLITNPALSYFHTHTPKFHYSFLINTSIAALGLDAPSFYSSTGCHAVG